MEVPILLPLNVNGNCKSALHDRRDSHLREFRNYDGIQDRLH